MRSIPLALLFALGAAAPAAAWDEIPPDNTGDTQDTQPAATRPQDTSSTLNPTAQAAVNGALTGAGYGSIFGITGAIAGAVGGAAYALANQQNQPPSEQIGLKPGAPVPPDIQRRIDSQPINVDGREMSLTEAKEQLSPSDLPTVNAAIARGLIPIVSNYGIVGYGSMTDPNINYLPDAVNALIGPTLAANGTPPNPEVGGNAAGAANLAANGRVPQEGEPGFNGPVRPPTDRCAGPGWGGPPCALPDPNKPPTPTAAPSGQTLLAQATNPQQMREAFTALDEEEDAAARDSGGGANGSGQPGLGALASTGQRSTSANGGGGQIRANDGQTSTLPPSAQVGPQRASVEQRVAHREEYLQGQERGAPSGPSNPLSRTVYQAAIDFGSAALESLWRVNGLSSSAAQTVVATTKADDGVVNDVNWGDNPGEKRAVIRDEDVKVCVRDRPQDWCHDRSRT